MIESLLGLVLVGRVDAPAPKPMPCTLELTENFKVQGPAGIRTERMTAHLVGTLQEQPGETGNSAFLFVQSGEDAQHSWAQATSELRPAAPGARALESFQGAKLFAVGPLRFDAPLKRGPLVPTGYVVVAGEVRLADGSLQPRQQSCVCFPVIATESWQYAPELRFGGPSLWALRPGSGLITLMASLDHAEAKGLDGNRYSGRVTVTFRVDTGKPAQTPAGPRTPPPSR